MSLSQRVTVDEVGSRRFGMHLHELRITESDNRLLTFSGRFFYDVERTDLNAFSPHHALIGPA